MTESARREIQDLRKEIERHEYLYYVINEKLNTPAKPAFNIQFKHMSYYPGD